MTTEWNLEKAESLRERYGVSFDDLAPSIERNDVLANIPHPNQGRYPGQRVFVVAFCGYAYVVPYIPREAGPFLKTLWPSRKATRDYLRTAGGN